MLNTEKANMRLYICKFIVTYESSGLCNCIQVKEEITLENRLNFLESSLDPSLISNEY